MLTYSIIESSVIVGGIIILTKRSSHGQATTGEEGEAFLEEVVAGVVGGPILIE